MSAYVILGMHKSGTTLIAQTLHRAGVRTVEAEQREASYDEGNKYEWERFKAINFELLGCRDDYSLTIDLQSPLRISASVRTRAAQLVEDCYARFNVWGFKDPRTALTYDFWRDPLDRHALIAVYRCPREVFTHYQSRTDDAQYVNTVLSHWNEYNSRIAGYLENARQPWIALSFESLMADDAEWERFERFMGRRLADVRETSLYRSRLAAGQAICDSDDTSPVTERDKYRDTLGRLEALRRRQ